MKEQHTDRKRVWTEKSDNLTSEWKRLAKMTPQEYYAEFKAKQVHLRIFKEVDFFSLFPQEQARQQRAKEEEEKKQKEAEKAKEEAEKAEKGIL